MNLFNTIRKRSDEELMQKIKESEDEDAFDELYRRYSRRIQGFFFRMLGGNRTLSADFTQEVFLRIWSSRIRYKNGSNLSTWLFTIAYNLCKNEYRHQSHNIFDYIEEEDNLPQHADENDAEIDIDNETIEKALTEALESMSPINHTLFALRYEEEFTIAEIATVTGIPEGTVKSRLHYLMKKLRKQMQSYT